MDHVLPYSKPYILFGGDIMEHIDLISLIGNTGFPIAITAYLLIRLEKQLTSLSNSINTLNTIVSVKLGAVVKDEKDNLPHNRHLFACHRGERRGWSYSGCCVLRRMQRQPARHRQPGERNEI